MWLVCQKLLTAEISRHTFYQSFRLQHILSKRLQKKLRWVTGSPENNLAEPIWACIRAAITAGRQVLNEGCALSSNYSPQVLLSKMQTSLCLREIATTLKSWYRDTQQAERRFGNWWKAQHLCWVLHTTCSPSQETSDQRPLLQLGGYSHRCLMWMQH